MHPALGQSRQSMPLFAICSRGLVLEQTVMLGSALVRVTLSWTTAQAKAFSPVLKVTLSQPVACGQSTESCCKFQAFKRCLICWLAHNVHGMGCCVQVIC